MFAMFAEKVRSRVARFVLAPLILVAIIFGGSAAAFSGCYPTIPAGCCHSGDTLDWIMPNNADSVGLCILTYKGTPHVILVDGSEVFYCHIPILSPGLPGAQKKVPVLARV